MKVIKSLLSIALCLFFYTNSAQTINWGAEADAGTEMYKMGWHEGFLYNAQFNFDESFLIQKIANDMSVALSKEIKIEGASNTSPVHFQISDDQIQVFIVKELGKSEGGTQLFLETFDLEGDFIKSKLIYAFEKKGLKSFGGSGSIIASSADGKKLALAQTLYANGVKESFDIQLYTFDSNGENLEVFSKSIVAYRDLKSRELKELFIDSKGNFIVNYAVQEYTPYRKYSKLLILDDKGSTVVDRGFKFDDVAYAQVEMELSDDDRLYITGMLEKAVNGRLANVGFFISNFSKETFVLNEIQEFKYEEDFFLKLGYKVKDDGRVSFKGVYLLELVIEKNKGFLIASHRMQPETVTYDAEILVIPFDSELKLSGTKVIPRLLTLSVAMQNGFGYFSFIENGGLKVIYTDHSKNLEINELDNLKITSSPNSNNAVLYLATVNPNEPIQRSILSISNPIEGYLIPKKCQAEDGRYVLNVMNKGKVIYGEVKF